LLPTLTISKRLAIALLSGSISYLAYPSPNFWPAIFLSVAGLYVSIRGLNFWRGVLVGFVGGAAYYVAQIYWISQYLGPEPLIGLASIEAVIFCVGSGFIAWTSKRISNSYFLSGLVSSIWVGREWFATHFPYGGFPWSRVAMSQADSPLAFWVSLGGFGVLSFVIVYISVLAVELLKVISAKSVLALTTATALVFIIPIALSQIPSKQIGTLKIAGIQGNANAGLFAHEAPGTIRDNHLEATSKLLKSGQKFDLVVWPENASDINPDVDPETKQILSDLVNSKLDRPLIFGTITSTGDHWFNSSKLWLPGRGEVDQYDKKRPVPFGEYVPDRDFFYAISPDLIGMIYRGYDFGTRDGIFNVGSHHLGILICFEEAIDELPRDLVTSGAQVIIAQTNNADFGHSDESVQQLAIARLRAIETGRSLVNISTVGPSAIIDSHGRLLDSTKAYVSDYVLADVPLSNQKTLTMLGGWLFDPVAAGMAAAWCLWLVIEYRRKTTKL
jgi:apolipoprotein N-acyltransferase